MKGGDGLDPLKRVQMITTPSGPMALYRPIAERLLKEGVISGTLDGPLHATDAATVKAATMAGGVCDFCSAPGTEVDFDVPDFDLPLGVGRSTDGWAACRPCADLIAAGKRQALLKRSVEGMTFGKFSKAAITELHDTFWRALDLMSEAKGVADALTDWVDDKLLDPPEWSKPITARDQRIATLGQMFGLSRAELDEALSGTVTPALAVKLHAWSQKFGQKITAQTLRDHIGGPRKPLPSVVPHWQQALDAKFEVVQTLTTYLRQTTGEEYFPETTDVTDTAAVERMARKAAARRTFRQLGFDQDLRLLPHAQVYSFNAETEAAIIEAAASLPHDAPLSAVETPNTGTGWFWFGDPLAVRASPLASNFTHALLWSWVPEVGVPQDGGPGPLKMTALVFSAYVLDEKGGVVQGKLMPSTRWYWPLDLSLHDMLAFNGNSWKKTYGPGSPLEHDSSILGEDETVKVIANLSLFFMQACLWFRQTVPGTTKKLNPILTTAPGHIERHARKRYVKEHKLSDAPVVHVVALRRTACEHVVREVTDGDHAERTYHYRWIVKGHPRKQRCGPGRKDIKVIWIEAHPAGPEDKPLKTKTTVFAVVR